MGCLVVSWCVLALPITLHLLSSLSRHYRPLTTDPTTSFLVTTLRGYLHTIYPPTVPYVVF